MFACQRGRSCTIGYPYPVYGKLTQLFFEEGKSVGVPQGYHLFKRVVKSFRFMYVFHKYVHIIILSCLKKKKQKANKDLVSLTFESFHLSYYKFKLFCSAWFLIKIMNKILSAKKKSTLLWFRTICLRSEEEAVQLHISSSDQIPHSGAVRKNQENYLSIKTKLSVLFRTGSLARWKISAQLSGYKM